MNKLAPLDFYLLRIPTFPFENILKLNEILDTKKIDLNRDNLREIFSDINFKSALFLASKELFNLLEAWIADYGSAKKEEKFLLSLHKYYSRMCTRATPYGLFAGFSLGSISIADTTIRLAAENMLPSSRIDMKFVEQLKNSLINSSVINKKIIYFPNNTIYQVGNKIRYIEYVIANQDKKYSLAQVNCTEILEDIISVSREGITISQLVKFIKQRLNEIPVEDIETYVSSLINAQILIDNISPIITNNFNVLGNFKDSIKKLVKADELNALEPINSYLNNNFNTVNLESLVSTTKFYQETLDADIDQIIQVDLKRLMESNNINIDVINEIVYTSEKLMSLERKKTSSDLINFKTKFHSKFEDQEIPLNIAIDVNAGVGYGFILDGNVEDTPLLDKILTFSKTNTSRGSSSQLEIFLADKLHECDYNNDSVIVIKDEDIDRLTNLDNIFDIDNNGYEDYHLIGMLLSKSQKDIDNGDYKFFTTSNSPTPSLGNLLSRFATSDNLLREKLESYYRYDSILNNSDDIIVAEIVHHPGSKVGNILLRPNYYNYEIPYLSHSNANKDNQIPLSDIMVSIRNNKIVIRSKKLNKEILPRLTSAHNFPSENLPVFRFLCDLQLQSVNPGFSWDWDRFIDRDFLPRIEYRKFILSPASWRLKCPANIDEEIYLNEFLKKFDLPNYCLLSEGDNQLFIDINNSFCLKHVSLKLKSGIVTLTEYFCDTNSNMIKYSDFQSYTSELIIPIKNTTIKVSPERKSLIKDSQTKRNYFPGEDWIYFKVYCSSTVSDEILYSLKEIIDCDTVSSSISKWFFIRYADPDNHIRIRFKLNKYNVDLGNLNNKILEKTESYRRDGLIDRIQIDTYKQEIERYGKNSMEESESLFYYDSKAILAFFSISNLQDDENLRWKIAIASVDMLLNDFNLTPAEKYELINQMSNEFITEFIDKKNLKESNKILKKSLDQKLRIHKCFLESLVNGENPGIADYNDYIQPFENRSEENKDVISALYLTRDKQEVHELIRSYIHMSINRFFNSKQRMHEMVIYYLLSKTYNSIIARKIYNK